MLNVEGLCFDGSFYPEVLPNKWKRFNILASLLHSHTQTHMLYMYICTCICMYVQSPDKGLITPR